VNPGILFIDGPYLRKWLVAGRRHRGELIQELLIVLTPCQ
jgi:hypothetical protein